MFSCFGKKSVKKEYEIGTTALQLSLYEVLISILKDELGSSYSIEKIKNAAAITVNRLGLRTESRPDPLEANDELAKSLRGIIELSLIKEAIALILLFTYFMGDKKEKQYLDEAKKLDCSEFETIYNMMDIDQTTPKKVKELASAISHRIHEIANFDIRNDL
ncbi:hypothetical protein Dalk_1461 [Desulfatibacillum aliphaticivorans]|uniref:Uncharacterized protein n=1 Tax=Desulfatibacillum aliphaticivorans TaxID=218208 RepID=B8FA65_DESAL|nr:hypothetical protein [Desulfatibacillum aliphaticivorans]ACL03161.1 hypothetical protein Dalk_1461 [Desulfatibacillum aliphaticivorans]